MVPAGFLTAQFLQKALFMKPLFFWQLAGPSFTVFLEERECIEKLEG